MDVEIKIAQKTGELNHQGKIITSKDDIVQFTINSGNLKKLIKTLSMKSEIHNNESVHSLKLKTIEDE